MGSQNWDVLDRLDQLIVFEAFIKDMEKKEDTERKAARSKERRTERCNREALKVSLLCSQLISRKETRFRVRLHISLL